jgi:hypothetical protein
MNFYPNPSGITSQTFLALQDIQRVAKNPLFGAISLHGTTGPLPIKNPRWQDQRKALETVCSLSTAKIESGAKAMVPIIGVKNYER